MKKEEVRRCFELYAERNSIFVPFVSIQTSETTQVYSSERHIFFLEDEEKEEYFLRSIFIKDGYVHSVCKYKVKSENFNTEKFQEVADLFGETFECSAYSNTERNTIAVSILYDYEHMTSLTNNDLNSVFTEACYLCRLLADNLEKIDSDMTPEEIMDFLTGNQEQYFEGEIQVLEKETRYHFEHRFLRDLFYHDTEEVMDILKQEDINGFYKIEDSFFLPRNLPFVAEYEHGQVKIEVMEEINCIHLKMPAPACTLECTDILLYYCKETGEKGYYTVEYDMQYNPNKNKKHRKSISYFPCMWTADQSHLNMGGFRTQEEAWKHLLDVLLNK